MKTAVRRILLMSALMSPGALYALGLGEIHLNSALNQPFDADIELVSATQEDLGALRAALANNDTFARYGLDRPGFLTEFSFRVAKGSGGQDVLKVTSPRPVTEPFVTLLVEANWPRGRLLREYTVLLDPPVFAPTPAAAEQAVAPPRATSGSGGGSMASAGEAPASTSSGPPSQRWAPAGEASIQPGSSYRVRRNDTLWDIASAANPGSRADVNREMVAIYQKNPGAFEGNINVLRQGSLLNIPQSGEISSISASAASAEVARQYQAWKAGRATGSDVADESGRLRLVTPEQGTAAPSTSTQAGAAAAGQSAQLNARVKQLESELAEARRLLEVRDAELATLQGQAKAPATAPAQPAQEAAPPASSAAEAAVSPEAAAAAGSAAQPPAEAAQPPKKEAKPPKKRPTPPAPEEPSLFAKIAEYWWLLLALVAAGIGALLFQRLRGSRTAAPDELEEALGRDLRNVQPPVATSRPSRESSILVEEKRPTETGAPVIAAAATPRAPEPSRRPVSIEDTLSGDGPASIEAGDPLAEADFHMAYGLYDQAADLVQLAIKREPRRRDLKLKLLEIFFVWGNRDRFLGLAREMHSSASDAPAGEWDKILIMGKQIAPDDSLFAASPRAGSAALDMELHGSTATLDMDLIADGGAGPDIDLGARDAQVDDGAGLDFVLDEPVRGAESASATSLVPTVEIQQPGGRGRVEDTEEVPIESLGLDVSSLNDLEDLEQGDDVFGASRSQNEDTAEQPTIGSSASLADTVENPAIRARAASLADTVESPAVRGFKTTSDTIEEPLARSKIEDTVEEPLARPKVDDTVEEDLLSSTSLMRMSANLTAPGPDASETQQTAIIDLSDSLDELASEEAARLKIDGTGDVDFSLGEEAATMSEVGTKLDLARAYIDMGDPEGARAILDEVLAEGNAVQKQEAQRLTASLP